VPCHREESQRSAGSIDVQECSAAFGQYFIEAGRNIGCVGWVSELCEKRGNHLSIIPGHSARKGGR
jgi:hypothetical protein